MSISSEQMAIEAALKRELQHVEMMINREIDNDYSFDTLSKIKSYIKDRLTQLSV